MAKTCGFAAKSVLRSVMRAESKGCERDQKVPLLPFLLNDIALSPALMQADGIHPNELGQPKLVANVWPSLLPLLRH